MNVLRFNFRNEENRKNVSAIMADEGYIVQNTNPQPGSYLMNIYILDESDTNKTEDAGDDQNQEATEIEEVE